MSKPKPLDSLSQSEIKADLKFLYKVRDIVNDPRIKAACLDLEVTGWSEKEYQTYFVTNVIQPTDQLIAQVEKIDKYFKGGLKATEQILFEKELTSRGYLSKNYNFAAYYKRLHKVIDPIATDIDTLVSSLMPTHMPLEVEEIYNEGMVRMLGALKQDKPAHILDWDNEKARQRDLQLQEKQSERLEQLSEVSQLLSGDSGDQRVGRPSGLQYLFKQYTHGEAPGSIRLGAFYDLQDRRTELAAASHSKGKK